MKIEGNTIIFKSDDEFYFKERDGIKPNTIRRINKIQEFEDIIDFINDIQSELKYIEIHNTKSPYLYFKRQIRDVSSLPGEWIWVFSWFHEENGVQAGFNAPIRKTLRHQKVNNR